MGMSVLSAEGPLRRPRKDCDGSARAPLRVAATCAAAISSKPVEVAVHKVSLRLPPFLTTFDPKADSWGTRRTAGALGGQLAHSADSWRIRRTVRCAVSPRATIDGQPWTASDCQVGLEHERH